MPTISDLNTNVRLASRWAQIAAHSPREAVTRMRIRSMNASAHHSHIAAREHGEPTDLLAVMQTGGFPGDENHDTFNQQWATFQGIWAQLETEVSTTGPHAGVAHDADMHFAFMVWVVVLNARATRVVETGVARGITSRVILEAFELQGSGHLWSIDLPPLRDPWHSSSGCAVPQRLRDRWTYIRGDARRELPRVLPHVAPIDVFIHDSLHTLDHMRFEFEVALRFLRPGGYLVSDDIGQNTAFSDLLDRPEVSRAAHFRHSRDQGHFGAIRIAAGEERSASL